MHWAQCWQGWAEPRHPQHPFRLYLLAPRTSGRQLRIQKQRLGSLLDKRCSWPRRPSPALAGREGRVRNVCTICMTKATMIMPRFMLLHMHVTRAYAVMHTCNHATMQPCGRATLTLLPCCHAQAAIQAGRQPCGHAIMHAAIQAGSHAIT